MPDVPLSATISAAGSTRAAVAQVNRTALLDVPAGTVLRRQNPQWRDMVATYGADLIWTFTLTEGDDATPVNLSGDSVRLVIQQYMDSTTTMIERTNPPGGHGSLDPGVSIFTVARATVMAAVEALDVNAAGTNYFYYEVRRLTSGLELVYLIGRVRVEPGLDV